MINICPDKKLYVNIWDRGESILNTPLFGSVLCQKLGKQRAGLTKCLSELKNTWLRSCGNYSLHYFPFQIFEKCLQDQKNIVQWQSSDQEDSSAPWPLIWFKMLKVSWGHEESVVEVTESRLWDLMSQDDPQHWRWPAGTPQWQHTASTHLPPPYRRRDRSWRARPGLYGTLPCLAWQSSSARLSSLMRKLGRLEDLI